MPLRKPKPKAQKPQAETFWDRVRRLRKDLVTLQDEAYKANETEVYEALREARRPFDTQALLAGERD